MAITAKPTFNNKKLHNMITAWIIKRQHPFLIIEEPELIEIFQYINPMVKLTKADTVKYSIMDLYEKGRVELKVTKLYL